MLIPATYAGLTWREPYAVGAAERKFKKFWLQFSNEIYTFSF